MALNADDDVFGKTFVYVVDYERDGTERQAILPEPWAVDALVSGSEIEGFDVELKFVREVVLE